MRRHRDIAGLCVLVWLMAATPRLLAQTQPQVQTQSPDLAAALALPISPGSIALLVEHGNDAAVQQRLREALADQRLVVRKTAAITIYAAGARMPMVDLLTALKKEEDPVAGAQEIRAIMTFQPAWFGECVAAAGRWGRPAADMATEMAV